MKFRDYFQLQLNRVVSIFPNLYYHSNVATRNTIAFSSPSLLRTFSCYYLPFWANDPRYRFGRGKRLRLPLGFGRGRVGRLGLEA